MDGLRNFFLQVVNKLSLNQYYRPSYAMSCFKLPISLCNELEQCCSNFWWNSKSSGGSLHWVRWRNMCRPKQFGGMGFRNLLAFNRALLAKQVWRIISDPSSLMAQVLKARYFKYDDIMIAQLGSKPSYVWRSILWSRDLIQKGILWRVGNGLRIKAYSDRWIPKLASGMSSLGRSNESLLVHELISPDRSWNEIMVRSIFPSFEAHRILEIPLRNLDSEDIRYWKWGKNGYYLVKSGFLLETGCFDPLESQSAYGLESWWKMIWKINIPQKVKIFLWRASNDLLPTEVNLFRRHIHATGSCFFCGSSDATTSHSLLFCPKVRDVWKATIFWSCLKKGKLLPFIFCGLILMNCFSTAEFEQFAMLAWAIWTDLCKLKHNIQIPNTEIKINWVFSYLEQFQKARLAFCASSEITKPVTNEKLEPPPMGDLRLDVDAGLKENLGICSVGAVIRNHLGMICAASASCYRFSGSVVDAELHAIHFGMLLALKCDFHNVRLFSDSIMCGNHLEVALSTMSYMKGDLLAKTRKLVKGLARAKPTWLKAMEKAPPATFPRAEKKLKSISLPEDVYVNKFFQKHPDSKHEGAIGISGFDPPAVCVFAWRVLELKDHGISDEDAIAVANMEYRNERKAKRKAFARLKQISRIQGRSPPPNPYSSAIKEIQAEERKFVHDRFYDSATREILQKLKQERAAEFQDRRGGFIGS